MKLNTSLFFGLLGSITLVASSGVSLHTTLQNNIIATSRSQASAIDIATLFPNTDMGNYDSNATPKNNEIIQFLYEQVKGTANEHVINDLNIGTSSGTTTVTTPVTVKPESSEYTGTINVTYTVKAKITLASFFNNLTIYNLENFGTKPSTFREFMIKLKTLPAFQSDDFNINQITNVDPYPVNVDAQNVYNVKIKPISTSSLYSDTNYQVTLKFSGATLAFHNLFNGSIANAGAFVNANKINETWLLQGLRTSNGIFNDEYPSISGNVTIFQDGATWKIKIENNPFYSNETLNILYSICNGLNVSGDMQVNDTGPIVTGNLYKYQLIIGSINYTSNFSNDLLTIFRNNATTGGYTLQDPWFHDNMLTFRQTHCPYTRQPDRTIGGYDASHFYINVSWGFASNCFLKIYNKTNDSLLATLPLEGLNDVWTTPTMFSTTMAQKISYQGNEFTFSSQYLMNSHDVTYVYSDSTWHYGDSSKNWRSGSCSAWIKIDDAPDQTLTNNNDFLTNKYYSNFHQTNAIYNT